MLRRSLPISTFSLARSKSCIETESASRRAASSAASFTRFSRSAPEKPGVPRAITDRLTSEFKQDAPHVHAQDRLAAAQVRAVHGDVAVEAARAQHRGVEHVGAVRRRDDDHALVRLEAVHLDEQLVQGLLALVVAAAETRAAVPADRVDLVDEDDARARSSCPAGTGRGRGSRRRRRTSRRSPSPRSRRTARPLRPRSRARAASCRCPAGRSGARPSGCGRPGA